MQGAEYGKNNNDGYPQMTQINADKNLSEKRNLRASAKSADDPLS